jgi:hypothetical protein
MRNDFFIVEKKKIDDFLPKLEIIENHTERHTKILEDKSGEIWQLTEYWIDTLNKNILSLYCVRLINFNSLFKIISESNNIEEIAIASTLIYFRKFDYDDKNREILLIYLESIFMRSEFDNKKIGLVIGETELYDSTNKKDILGKPYEEIQADYNYYNGIAIRAKKLMS